MTLLNAKKLGYLAATSALLALVAAQGCSSDDTQAGPSGGSTSKAGASGSTGKAGSSGSTGKAGGSTDEGGAAGATDVTPGDEGGMGGEGGMGAGGEAGATSCSGDQQPTFSGSCISCPAHFDNSTLSKLDQVGKL